MKEAKKTALHALIKSMNKKRMAPKRPTGDADVSMDEDKEDPIDHDGDYADDLHEQDTGEPDNDEEAGFGDVVKGFMKHGRAQPAAHKPGASLTVIMAGGHAPKFGGKKKG